MAYHHGDLRRTLLDAAAESIAEAGVAKLSLRALAKRVGVSNAAPTHHFGDKTGLLTALATEGFELLAESLTAPGAGKDLVDMGVAYVGFALAHPSHFAVMFEPSLHRCGDPGLAEAGAQARAALATGVADALHGSGGDGDDQETQLAAWSLVHGYATLVLSGAIEVADPISLARSIASHLTV
ncbi:putative TetR family transcriptional regulator [Gordonia araii NBRC 100433]|uniref:Putative TetR family transcriptional regulator n=1 Tax=Gordonia araii NBRC 100433 TaxID=1073574 RepID=G7GYZ0_9ACTN|nr:TetR/AcrR family transcriptional regulator [Gordonia araii]NNG97025.1 TetR/AcrR family transcriptional regulator [Gordonia araii NBRC 100433]GAB08815.1 putative TetR family transcriptional regulator [Gordonia araii NBRC 100433]